ncbi:MAG: response regulator [Desulfobulbaceae bacterium]|nr:response regulator [Desulfobulbaceae bacterium]
MKQDKPMSASELRRRADSLHREKYPAARARDEVDSASLRLVHELQVHQIELELQNEELRQSRLEVEAGLQSYTELYDFAPVGYLTLDRAGTILQVNLPGASLLGVERARLAGRRLGVFVSEADKGVFNAFLQKASRSHAKESCLVSLQTEEKGAIWVHLTAIISEGGLALHTVIQDITAQHELEQQLRVAEEKREAANKLLQLMIDGMEDTVVLVDASHQALQMNRAARQNLTRADACLLEQGGAITCHQLSHQQPEPCGGSDHPCPLTMVLQSGEATKVLHSHTRENGEQFPVEILATPIRDAENKVVGIIEVGRDISERSRIDALQKKLMEQDLRQQKEKSIATLASGIAHDFNNLLMGIMGNAELLQLHPSDDESKKMTTAIIHGGRKMAHLTRQLQAFAQKDHCQAEELNVNVILREALKQVAINKTIILDLQLKDDLWPVYIDRTQLIQLLRNLMQNAVESMEGTGGILTLTSTNETLTENWSCAVGHTHGPGEFVQVTVTDTGTGIPKDILPRIFDPFFSTKFVGRGLGLAAALGIVQRHDGAICLQNSENGAIVSVRLPRAVPVSVPVKQEDQTTTLPLDQDLHDKVVLVVDDDRSILLLTKATLQKAGYRVETVETGQGAETFWSRHLEQICFVILDIQLPDTTGIILYKRVKLLNPALPVIMNSGHDQATALEGMQLHSGDIFLQKPYDFRELVPLIESALKGKSLPNIPLSGE